MFGLKKVLFSLSLLIPAISHAGFKTDVLTATTTRSMTVSMSTGIFNPLMSSSLLPPTIYGISYTTNPAGCEYDANYPLNAQPIWLSVHSYVVVGTTTYFSPTHSEAILNTVDSGLTTCVFPNDSYAEYVNLNFSLTPPNQPVTGYRISTTQGYQQTIWYENSTSLSYTISDLIALNTTYYVSENSTKTYIASSMVQPNNYSVQSSSSYIWSDGANLKFKDYYLQEKTLSELYNGNPNSNRTTLTVTGTATISGVSFASNGLSVNSSTHTYLYATNATVQNLSIGTFTISTLTATNIFSSKISNNATSVLGSTSVYVTTYTYSGIDNFDGFKTTVTVCAYKYYDGKRAYQKNCPVKTFDASAMMNAGLKIVISTVSNESLIDGYEWWVYSWNTFGGLTEYTVDNRSQTTKASTIYLPSRGFSCSGSSCINVFPSTFSVLSSGLDGFKSINHISSGEVQISSASVSLNSSTLSAINNMYPYNVGQFIFCSDCTNPVCVSSGTNKGSWTTTTSASTHCN